VKSGWLADEAHRLDASAYAEGGLEVRDRIRGSWSWRPLAELSRVFRGPLHKRAYVSGPSRGVPYLTASDVPLADVPYDTWLSRRLTPELPSLLVEPGWTLVSSAGTIGNATYVREEFAECAVSQDMLRVAPSSAVPSGYLFAFLATAPARSMLRMRTYGSVVDRIEPKHVEDLPVPLLDEAVQHRVHRRVERAATARREALRLLDEASGWFDTLAGPCRYGYEHARAVAVVGSRSLRSRLDAFHHVGWAAEAGLEGERLDSVADVISTPRVPRVYAERGVPFLSGIDVFRVRPAIRVRLARHVAAAFSAIVHAGELAVQGSGQRYGLLGRVAHIGKRLDGWAASHDLFRVRTNQPDETARVFAYLRSDVGHRAMLRHSYGTSIPHVNPAGIAAVRIPSLPADLVHKAARALELREQADADEEAAITEVERWLA
jgi:type I restriction enzyme S subunit